MTTHTYCYIYTQTNTDTRLQTHTHPHIYEIAVCFERAKESSYCCLVHFLLVSLLLLLFLFSFLFALFRIVGALLLFFFLFPIISTSNVALAARFHILWSLIYTAIYINVCMYACVAVAARISKTKRFGHKTIVRLEAVFAMKVRKWQAKGR